MVGQTIGPYRILGRLGAGGMGEVFLAEDSRLGRRVAIKRATDSSLDPTEARERLRREAYAAAQLNHPNVAAIYDVLDLDGPPHIVMEYVEGETLASIVRRSPLPPEPALAIARQIADALVDAHAHGVIHRDLKPANVMVTAGGRVKVLDFGLAREPIANGAAPGDAASKVTHIYGTPGYMAPEQLMGRRGDARSDIYSFGALLFELLTGTPPFKGIDHLERVLASAGASDKPPEPRAINARVPVALNDVVVRALAFRPEARFQTAESLREALERAAGAMSEAPTARVDVDKASRRPLTWRGWQIGLAIGLVVLVAAAVAIRWRVGTRGTRASSTIVAVLPFEVAQGEADLEALGAGLAEMIVNGLAATDSVTAVPRSAALAYKGDKTRATDVQRIARDLGANHLVDGALRRTPGGVELTIRIVRVDRGDGWEHAYPGTFDDVLTLGRRILGDVVVQLGAEAPPAQSSTTSAEAFQHYAQGRGLLDRRDIPGNVDRAIGLLAAAVKREPDFALAHAALGEGYWEKYRQTRERAWVDRAEQEILVALSVDPNQPLVRYSLATILHGTGQRDRAEQELRTIVRTNPLDSAHRLLGILLTERGQVEEAMKEFQRAIDVRPGYWGNHHTKGIAALKTGRYPEAEASFLRITELQPDNADAYGNLGTIYLLTGQRDRAIEQFKRSIQSAPTVSAWSNLGNALSEAGRHDEALKAFREAVTLRPRDPLLQRNLGDSLARLGRTREARDAYAAGVKVAREGLEVNTKSPEAHGALAICLAKMGQFEEALQHVDRAVALAPKSHEPYHRRAAVLALAGRSGEAVAALQDAIKRGLSPAIVARDDDFKSLYGLVEFQQLVKPGP